MSAQAHQQATALFAVIRRVSKTPGWIGGGPPRTHWTGSPQPQVLSLMKPPPGRDVDPPTKTQVRPSTQLVLPTAAAVSPARRRVRCAPVPHTRTSTLVVAGRVCLRLPTQRDAHEERAEVGRVIREALAASWRRSC